MTKSALARAFAFTCGLSAAILAAQQVAAQESSSSGPTIGGSVLEQAYGTYSGSGAFAASDFGYGSSTTLGLNLDAKGQRARVSASLEAAVLNGESSLEAWYLSTTGFAPTDELFVPTAAVRQAAGGPDLLMAARVRTLYVKFDADWASLIAGRQVINYERGAVWSPTDIFTQLDLTGLSPVRLGSDAVRASVPLGTTGGLDLVAAPGTSPAQGQYSGRLSGLLLGVDGAFSAARDGSRSLTYAGFDFKADLEAGFYGDISYAQPDSGAQGTWRAAGGADWSAGDFIFEAEYYYNGGGAAFDPLFPGAHNVFASVVWRASELLDVSASVISDVGDQSGTATLLASLSAAQNATLALFGKAIWDRSGAPLGGEAILSGSIATVAAQVGGTLQVSF